MLYYLIQRSVRTAHISKEKEKKEIMRKIKSNCQEKKKVVHENVTDSIGCGIWGVIW